MECCCTELRHTGSNDLFWQPLFQQEFGTVLTSYERMLAGKLGWQRIYGLKCRDRCVSCACSGAAIVLDASTLCLMLRPALCLARCYSSQCSMSMRLVLNLCSVLKAALTVSGLASMAVPQLHLASVKLFSIQPLAKFHPGSHYQSMKGSLCSLHC